MSQITLLKNKVELDKLRKSLAIKVYSWPLYAVKDCYKTTEIIKHWAHLYLFIFCRVFASGPK
jgi:hypothetical protein